MSKFSFELAACLSILSPVKIRCEVSEKAAKFSLHCHHSLSCDLSPGWWWCCWRWWKTRPIERRIRASFFFQIFMGEMSLFVRSFIGSCESFHQESSGVFTENFIYLHFFLFFFLEIFSPSLRVLCIAHIFYRSRIFASSQTHNHDSQDDAKWNHFSLSPLLLSLGATRKLLHFKFHSVRWKFCALYILYVVW